MMKMAGGWSAKMGAFYVCWMRGNLRKNQRENCIENGGRAQWVFDGKMKKNRSGTQRAQSACGAAQRARRAARLHTRQNARKMKIEVYKR